MLRRLYNWIISHAEKPNALWVLAAISFAESSFFPLPPDLLLIPMVLAKPKRGFFIALVATLTSVLGGFLGYAIGYFVFDSVGEFIIAHLWSLDRFHQVQDTFNNYGFWLIVGKGMTPIPYKIVTILCGVLHYNLLNFAIASVIARGMRFFLVAGLLYFFGERVRDFIEKRLGLVMIAFLVMLVGAFFALKFL